MSERRLDHAAPVEADPEAGVTPGEAVGGRDGDEVGGASLVTASGRELTERDIAGLADEAEVGYDIDHLLTKGDGETWQAYAHRLEERIKRQRKQLKDVQALRSGPDKSAREKIAALERLVGRKVAVIERLKESVVKVVADRDAADRRLVTVVDTFAHRRLTASDVVDAVLTAMQMSHAEVIYVHQLDHEPFAAIVVAGTEPYAELHHREHEYEMVHDRVEPGMF